MRVRLVDIDVGYTRMGEGPPAVMLHGLAEDRSSWADVQRRLSDFTTYAYDLRGHGESDLGEAEGTLEQLGGDLIAFLEAQTGPADCIGYSLGGAVVLWVAARRPDLVTRATVAGTSTVVGRRAAEFFRDRIETIRSDFSRALPARSRRTRASSWSSQAPASKKSRPDASRLSAPETATSMQRARWRDSMKTRSLNCCRTSPARSM